MRSGSVHLDTLATTTITINVVVTSLSSVWWTDARRDDGQTSISIK